MFFFFVGVVSSVDNRVENGRWEKCDGFALSVEKCYLWRSVEKCYLDDGGSEMSGAGTDFPTELHDESASG